MHVTATTITTIDNKVGKVKGVFSISNAPFK